MSDATESTAFPTAMAAFAERLAGSDLAIYGIAYDYLHFGSWTIELGRRHRRLLVQWDGKESLLSCSVTAAPNSQAPRAWTLLEEIPLGPDDVPVGVLARAEALALAHIDRSGRLVTEKSGAEG